MKIGVKSKSRHYRRRETPLAIYTGLMNHAKTRKRGLIEKDCLVMDSYFLWENTRNYQCSCKQRMFAVWGRRLCLPNKVKEWFIHGRGCIARNAMESFHGTAISVIQLPTHEKRGTDRDTIAIDTDTGNKNVLSATSRILAILASSPCFLAPVWLLCTSFRSS